MSREIGRRSAQGLKHAVLDYWFGTGWQSVSKYHPFSQKEMLWWEGGPQADEDIRNRFGEDIERAARHEYDNELKNDPKAEGDLALVLLFDQFSRNVFRGSFKAFAYDAAARDIARNVVHPKNGQERRDRELPILMKYFFAMPFMHEESLEGQELCLRLINEMKSECSTVNSKEALYLRDKFNEHQKFAKGHREIIERFGRFPHRNKAMGRHSTNEEEEYLKTANSYGQ